MPVDKTRLENTSQSSPTHSVASQTLTPRSRMVGSLVSGVRDDTVHGTSNRLIRQFMLVRLPPPTFLIRFR